MSDKGLTQTFPPQRIVCEFCREEFQGSTLQDARLKFELHTCTGRKLQTAPSEDDDIKEHPV